MKNYLTLDTESMKKDFANISREEAKKLYGEALVILAKNLKDVITINEILEESNASIVITHIQELL